MMHLEIVGQDSPYARLLAESAKVAVNRLGLSADVQVANNREEIAQYRTTVGPGLYIDGVLVSAGSILSADDVCNLIRWRHPQVA